MHIQFYIIFILTINTMITSCTTAHQKTNPISDYHTYKKAQNQLKHKHYSESIQDLLNLQNLHLLNPYPQHIHLSLIYAYYKSNNLKLANNSIQHFLKLYPNYKNLDYVLYMHGIINMSLDKNNMSFLKKHLNGYWDNFNSNYAETAFSSFSQVVQKYPHSQYYIDSYNRLIILKNRIADYELSIIKFYYQKHAYISVIIRSEKMLRYFSDTQATLQALHYMQKAYQHMHLPDQSEKIQQIISEN